MTVGRGETVTDFKAPYFSKNTLRDLAEGFLRQHHASRSIPVPIELIVERMGIDIVPVPSLQLSCEVDAYTTSNLKEIVVEEFVYLHRPGRYRFSLAHEVGHICLHGDLFRSLTFRSAHEWKAFVNSIPEREYGFLEFHANEFAGHALVPRVELLEEVKRCKETVLKMIPDAAKDPDSYREFVAECIASRFEASPAVALKRLDREDVVIP